MKQGKKIWVLFLLAIASIGSVYAAVNMNIDPPQQNMNVGDQFSLNIQIDPQGTTVAGIQADIRFNPAVLQVVKVVEGNFLNRGGSTFFNSGTINNNNGEVNNIATGVLYVGGQNSIGTFVTINFKAIAEGNSQIDIVNPLISDPDNNKVDSAIQNGVVYIMQVPVSNWVIGGFIVTAGIISIIIRRKK